MDPSSITKSSRTTGPRRAPLGTRIWAAAAAAGSLAVLVAAALITPSPEGYNTHTQLGLAPCAWAALSGKPCPTCGMTTAFAHAANLDLLASIQTQPFGAFLAVVTATSFWLCLHTALTGSRVLELVGGLFRWWVWAAFIAGFVASWVYKMMAWEG
ncbi:MAG: DUF2752 domain-containing protein [Phycisphaerales bacterium]